ncbi:MAG: hypothetical protein AB7Y46_08055 [Armatimonadota bacterium]
MLVATLRRRPVPRAAAREQAAAWTVELCRDLPIMDAQGRGWARRVHQAILPLFLPEETASARIAFRAR